MKIYFDNVTYQGQTVIFDYDPSNGGALTLSQTVLLKDGTTVNFDQDSLANLLDCIEFDASKLLATDFQYHEESKTYRCTNYQNIQLGRAIAHHNHLVLSQLEHHFSTAKESKQNIEIKLRHVSPKKKKTNTLKKTSEHHQQESFVAAFNLQAKVEKQRRLIQQRTLSLTKILSFESDSYIWRKTYMWHPSRKQIMVEDYRLKQRASSPILNRYYVEELLLKNNILGIMEAKSDQIKLIEDTILPIINKYYLKMCEQGSISNETHIALILYIRKAIAEAMSPHDYNCTPPSACDSFYGYEGSDENLAILFLTLSTDLDYVESIDELKGSCISIASLKETQSTIRNSLSVLETIDDCSTLDQSFIDLSKAPQHIVNEKAIEYFIYKQFLLAMCDVYTKANDIEKTYENGINALNLRIQEIDAALSKADGQPLVAVVNMKSYQTQKMQLEHQRDQLVQQSNSEIPYHRFLPKFFFDDNGIIPEIYINHAQYAFLQKIALAFLVNQNLTKSDTSLKKFTVQCKRDKVPQAQTEQLRSSFITNIKQQIDVEHCRLVEEYKTDKISTSPSS